MHTSENAAKHMAGLKERSYTPHRGNKKIYDTLYREYEILHDYFGRGGNDVMKRLKALSVGQKIRAGITPYIILR